MMQITKKNSQMHTSLDVKEFPIGTSFKKRSFYMIARLLIITFSERLELEAYLQKLYGSTSHYVTLRALRLNRNQEMTRITQIKSGLSDIFVKFHLDDDGITCRPLKINGQYL